MTQSTGCQLSVVIQSRFYQRRNTYLIVFKVITGLFVIASCHSRANLENNVALISQLIQLQLCNGFTIAEHEELLE